MNLEELNRIAKKDRTGSDATLKLIGALAVFIFLLPALFAYTVWAHAYVGVHLWAWFIVPTFGLPTLKMPVAWGMALLIGLWAYDYNPCKS